LSVKNVAAAVSSSVHGPTAFETPTSGLNDQRLVPMLTSLVLSYWPQGTVTRKLAPTIRSCSQPANSFSVSEGAPYRFADKRNAALVRPLTVRCRVSPLYSAFPDSQAYGTTASTLPDWPHRSSTRAYAITALDVVSCGSVIGSEESNETPPRVYA
jgi:hypothetical protein